MVVALAETVKINIRVAIRVAGGGGGGSGFVLTSSTISNAPSGYMLTDEKYYLADAGTYSYGETGFVTTPASSGDGYARITITSQTITTNVTRWINIEKQKANGTLTGNFDYGSCYIAETDSNGTLITHNGQS